jgi:outer membrane protein TolC
MRKRIMLFLLVAALPAAEVPKAGFENSPRVRELMRAGNLYLSVSDALALAIENNLDIELQRHAFSLADTDVLRARGGGTPRGVGFVLSEMPNGVGGPASPVVTNPATASRTSSGASVTTNLVNSLAQPQANLSIQGAVPQAGGTAVPAFDPVATGLANWTHQTAPQTSVSSYGTSALTSNTTSANAGVQKAFDTGTLVNLAFLNSRQSWNSLRANYNPFTASSFGLTVTQPLRRGFGAALNRRFIDIAGNNRKITGLLFEQQLVATVYGVIRLYTDFMALYEDEKVKQESVALAAKLLADVKAQVEEGTLAPVELTRAGALVFTSRQDLINAQGLLEEQEAILKTVLTRRGNEDAQVRAARIIPTDPLRLPDDDQTRPMEDLITQALARRPDLGQARFQIENAEIGLRGTRNALLPQVDLVGVMQNNALAGAATPFVLGADPNMVGGYGTALEQMLARKYPTYGIGVQVALPLRNRVAEADLARDQIQLRQQQIRLRLIENQARLEVEDALIAMRRARASWQAAVEARGLQQESLAAEQAKFEVGASTSYFVIQYESLLAQARSTEVAARSAYAKARAALQRATGTILEENQISVAAAAR